MLPSRDPKTTTIYDIMTTRKRYVLVGTGGRGVSMFGRPLLTDFPDTAELVGLFDSNPLRLAAANELLGTQLPVFTDITEMLRHLDPDGVIVATRDCTHAEFVIQSLEAGKRVYSEKPLCTTAKQCRDICAAAESSAGDCFVTHNWRYANATNLIREILRDGRIGNLLSIEFRETLDRNHGADYFRRWHRIKANSGGLLIHKASHHFDVLNWWADSKPATLSAMGGTFFYGRNGPFRHTRCQGCPHAKACDFFVDFAADDQARRLYLDAESADGYVRDRCLFDESIDIEDQAAVLYSYENGVRVVYSLIAYAAYEGQLIVLEGTEARLEYEIVHSMDSSIAARVVPGLDEVTGERLTLIHPRHDREAIDIPAAAGEHGGCDPALRQEFFGQPWTSPQTERMAVVDEAIQAVLIGAAANASIADGSRPVAVQALLQD